MGIDIAKVIDQLHDYPEITFAAEPLVWFAIVGNIQLACRHPGNIGPSRRLVEDLARQISERLAEIDPDIGRALERGWYSCFDSHEEQS